MGLLARFKATIPIVTVAVAIYALCTGRSHGVVMGLPFDFRVPTPARVKKRWWNDDDPRLFTPHVFGVGWSVNIAELRKRLGAAREEPDS